jgi:transcription-repair coupling factor (superfamily II helicase)
VSSDLSGLLSLIEEMPAYRRLLAELEAKAGSSRAAVLEAARPYVTAATYRKLNLSVLVITAQPERARELAEQLAIWLGREVGLLPEPELLPYQRVAMDSSTELDRIEALAALAGRKPSDEPPLLVASAAAFTQKVASYNDFISAWHTVSLGMEVAPEKLMVNWQAIGYRVENLVEVPGAISRRGGIVDIYPANAERPVRLEFFGNTIDSLRYFDPPSQRSSGPVSSLEIGPAAEVMAPYTQPREAAAALATVDLSGCSAEACRQMAGEIEQLKEGQRPDYLKFYASLFNDDSILNYLPQNGLVVLDEPEAISQAAAFLETEAEGLRADKLKRGELPPNFPRPYFTWPEMEEKLNTRKRLVFASWGGENHRGHHLDFTAVTNYTGRLPAFFKKVKQLKGSGQRLIINSYQASRLSELLAGEGITATPVEDVKRPPAPGSVTLVQGALAHGWAMEGGHFYSDAELFGFIKQRRRVKKHAVARRRLFVDISPGDFVVHVDHGLARFGGITTMAVESSRREYLVLEYAAGDRLYVPTDQIDRVSRYIGAGEQPPALNRLGGLEWGRAKRKAGEAAAEVAEELLGLYAAREVVPGFAFSPDTVWQQEFEASFPYVETEDQVTVQKHVKQDMEATRPMDRLILGDVGYGKTEVAIRAAFKAVMDGKQVAVLVPTTVLAQQHYNTFRGRLVAFPIRVEVLSRFRTRREQQDIIQGLAGGGVDIVIGTHRLLQPDVAFKELGLIIIDEEQRFGVVHKEYLKKMRREVDILTLSATPIPRTLHMSLTEVRDMSTIETPPEERLPIKTYVAAYEERLVREAVLREIERNGQVFFVHNRVQGIKHVAAQLEKLLPEARLAIGHGQMPEHRLEEVMAGFSRGDVDVLVCTTIIESGLDVPNANTLIVNRADRFGLTQLYQLRGRVGRGANLAYAYFLYEKGKRLSPEAEKRLRTIFEATELGAGFGIAMKDLEIRGAGNLLGARQSGHINSVGFSLYTRLLAEAVEELKAGRAGKSVEEIKLSRLPPPSVALPLPAFIPEDYVTDVGTRLSLYQCLAGMTRPEQTVEMANDFADRFGPPPPEVTNLLYAVKIKALAARAGVESITTEAGQILLKLLPGLELDRKKLEPVLEEGIRAGRRQMRLDPKRLGGEWWKILEEVLGRMA